MRHTPFDEDSAYVEVCILYDSTEVKITNVWHSEIHVRNSREGSMSCITVPDCGTQTYCVEKLGLQLQLRLAAATVLARAGASADKSIERVWLRHLFYFVRTHSGAIRTYDRANARIVETILRKSMCTAQRIANKEILQVIFTTVLLKLRHNG